jgi:hypothetical protein
MKEWYSRGKIKALRENTALILTRPQQIPRGLASDRALDSTIKGRRQTTSATARQWVVLKTYIPTPEKTHYFLITNINGITLRGKSLLFILRRMLSPINTLRRQSARFFNVTARSTRSDHFVWKGTWLDTVMAVRIYAVVLVMTRRQTTLRTFTIFLQKAYTVQTVTLPCTLRHRNCFLVHYVTP